MNAITADFVKTNNRPTSSKLAALLRALADRFDEKSIEKTKAKQRLADARAIQQLASDYEAYQPNLAAELRFIAARG